MEGLIGKKVGMTQIWNDEGQCIPVTVIELGPCPIVQVKTVDVDGYSAVQVGFEEQKPQRLSKAARVRFEKAAATPTRILREFAPEAGEELKAGEVMTVALFEGVQYVDVRATTKGRGFAGVVRRYRFRGGPMTHGGHSKRRPGGLAARDLPGWIQKGKKMPGHMGSVARTTQNIKVAQIIPAENLMLVQGAVPGPAGGTVIVTKALKKAAK